MDFRQLQQIEKTVIKKDSVLSQSDIKEIEPEVLTKVFKRHTFFSLFSELGPIYDLINDHLRIGTF